MPSACSERSARWRPGRWGPPLLLGVLVPFGPTSVRAENPWLRGHFPVAAFQAYTSHYGLRDGPSGDPESHHGLDIAAPLGSPVRSWWGGRIAEVIVDRGCGIGLVVRSGAWEHIYCHLGGSVQNGLYRAEGVLIGPGQPVRRGQLIGRIGMTGRTTGPHLHWALRYDGRWLDPAMILRAMAHARRQMAPNLRPEPRVGQSR